jgi:hypothetical protein
VSDSNTFWLDRAIDLKFELREALAALELAHNALKRSRDRDARAKIDEAIEGAGKLLARIKAEDEQRSAELLAQKMESNRAREAGGLPPLWSSDGRLIPVADRRPPLPPSHEGANT